MYWLITARLLQISQRSVVLSGLTAVALTGWILAKGAASIPNYVQYLTFSFSVMQFVGDCNTGHNVSEFERPLLTSGFEYLLLSVLLKVTRVGPGIMTAAVVKQCSANPSGCTACSQVLDYASPKCNYRTPTDGCSEWSHRSWVWIGSPLFCRSNSAGNIS